MKNNEKSHKVEKFGIRKTLEKFSGTF